MGNSQFQANTSKAASVSGKLMLAAVIVLFLVILFVLFLHLYAKWFWSGRIDVDRTPLRRRRRLVFVPTEEGSGHSARKGLDFSIIMALPVVIFNPKDFKDGLECAVCLSDLLEGEKARLLPECNHGYHIECIDMWFQSHSTCPLCRNMVSVDCTPQLQDFHRSEGENLASEYPNFPTNVLFWGNQTTVSTGGSETSLEDESSSSSSSRPERALVIEIPTRSSEGFSSISPSSARLSEEDMKSPATTRMRSLRRMLSREKRITPCSPNSVDIEQGEGGRRSQSLKTTVEF
ncbi:hypothetical protein GIB67_009759 [Kingdonia uniflora]|uniref:RING-type E3 ubiquitin transferase n=1 Tax=Kingdonia uniflora TaxID=39325 RepID=A0A7J7LBI7_9MAGN|nr:hypothetical protein GIB67_009759 [Kingdonia uniflora]